MKTKKKSVTISKKQYEDILDAWSKTNVLCAYMENPEVFTEKFTARDKVFEIFKHLDRVVTKLPD